jgi:hypothetical protein
MLTEQESKTLQEATGIGEVTRLHVLSAASLFSGAGDGTLTHASSALRHQPLPLARFLVKCCNFHTLLIVQAQLFKH